MIYFPITQKLFRAICLLLFLTTSVVNAQSNSRPVEEAKGIQVGTMVNDFSATDLNGNTFRLSSELAKGPVVLIFYRGQWCPVCNRHMSKLQDSLKFITDKGAQLVAVSPEKPEYLKMSAEKSDATFTLLYDEGYRISDQFDVTFKPESGTRIMYNTLLGANLKKAHSDDSEQLPVPATFIIDKSGKVTWRHFDINYKNRASVKEILENL